MVHVSKGVKTWLMYKQFELNSNLQKINVK